MKNCRICGELNCQKHALIMQVKDLEEKTEFSGSSPPEIFIGRYNYPNVYVGILSPEERGNTTILSSQELWHKKKFSIQEIQDLRSKLIYGRKRSNIKKVMFENRFIKTLQEVSMSSKSIATEFKLNKPIEENKEHENHIPLIRNAANVKFARLEENPIIPKKVDYLVNDIHSKATTAVLELEKNIPTSSIIKILSAGLLGIGNRRKLVPTRWSITAVDDTLSKEKIEKIRYYPEISEILVFHAEYLGNRYNFILLPEKFSFEVIEINSQNIELNWHDYESFFGRKNYANSVTGAYYANRLALTEYLETIKKQASCLVLREISEEYTQSMGVGILRQISREAFSNPPEIFQTLREAFENIQGRIKISIEIFKKNSIILQNYGKQKKLNQWFK